MKVERLPREYFNRFSENPVDIRPFDPDSKKQSYGYLEILNKLLSPFEASAELFGSTELEIDGKGEWEFAVWLTDGQWYPVLTQLINHYRSIYTLLEDFAVFNDIWAETKIEVIPMRGETARRNRAIMDFWRNNPAAVKEYEQAKYQYAHSRREYYWWKENFIADILESL